MIEPNKSPCVVELMTDLDSLQKAVSIGAPEQGLIEFVYLEDNVSIMCNEEGKLIGLEPNRRLGNDILVGTVYVVAENDEGELMSLTNYCQSLSPNFQQPKSNETYIAILSHILLCLGKIIANRQKKCYNFVNI